VHNFTKSRRPRTVRAVPSVSPAIRMPDPSSQPPRRRDEQAERSEWIRFTGLGFEFIAAVVVCGAIGYGLDRWLGLTPWMLIAGVAMGFVVGLAQLVRSARKIFHD
jgi:F0F1-type ATP synthase assembly protein I